MSGYKDKFDRICDILNVSDYHNKGYKGQNVIIASMESIYESDDHGFNVMRTVKTYAPDAKVISFTDEKGYSAMSDNGEHIAFPEFADWCIEHNVDIITSSLDWNSDKEEEKEAIRKLYDNGIIFCNCAGNNGYEITRNPNKTYQFGEEIITVSGLSLDSNNKITWAGYNYGETIDAVTFGKILPFKYENENWSIWSGTSAATPLMAALLALVKSTGFNLTSKGVFALIDLYNKPIDYKGRTYKMFVLPPLNELLTRITQEEPKKGDEVMDNKDKPSEWAEEAINYLKEKGITDGTRPKDNITREEVLTLLYRIIQKVKKDYE